jgi:mannose-6-phosphate isomerase-like protein (cupin superfamily)
MHTVKRPWGKEDIIEKHPGYWIKKLYVKRGKRCSLQSHRHRSELWAVVSGKILATVGSRQIPVSSGEMVMVEKGQKHRIQGITDACIVEVAFGRPLQNDITRYEDDYGRAKK